jgi:transposase
LHIGKIARLFFALMSTICESPEQIDQKIWNYHVNGWSMRRISNATHTGFHRILDVINAYKKGLHVAHNRGGPRKVTPEVKEWVISLTVANGGISSASVSHIVEDQTGIVISRQTVQNIRHEFNFRWGRAKKCPMLTDEHVYARVQFAKDFESEMFHAIRQFPFVFTDESRFCYCADNHWVWKRPGEHLYANLAPVQKFPKFSIMVWGAIGIGFKSNLIIFDGSVNAETYMQALRKSFFIEADQAYSERHWVLVQDGATCHWTPDNIAELTRQCLVCPSWPPNSPDLNPIENVWGIIKMRMKWFDVRSREQAVERITAIWNSIEMPVINGLCAAFPARVELMAQACGQTIQPLLSSHYNTVPAGYLSDRPPSVLPSPWTSHEDAIVLRHLEQKPKCWLSLKALLPGKSVCSVRNRWGILRTRYLNEKNGPSASLNSGYFLPQVVAGLNN